MALLRFCKAVDACILMLVRVERDALPAFSARVRR